MNCTTGEISNDPRVFEAWREDGHRILELPGADELESLAAEAELARAGVPRTGELLQLLGGAVVAQARDEERAARTAAREFSRAVQRATPAQAARRVGRR